jgi:hypothetical protein
MDQLHNFNALTKPLEDLALAAHEAYKVRQEYDMESGIFKPRDREQESRFIANETRIGDIQEQAANLRGRRQDAADKLPPHLCTSTDPPLVDLEAALLVIEEQKLLGILGMMGQVDTELVRAQCDLEDVRDRDTRAALDGPLRKLQDALWDAQSAFTQYGGPRLRTIEQDLVLLHSRPSGYRKSTSPEAKREDAPGTDDDDYSDIPTLDLGSPCSSLGEALIGEEQYMHGDVDEDEDRVFRFDPDDRPSLLHISNWLGLDNSVSAAILLNEKPIDRAFAAYRAASSPGANHPERLKAILPLFTFSRQSLQQWQNLPASTPRDERLDFSAAVFAHRVVRFLEGSSCEEVEWKPLFDDQRKGFESLQNYDVAKRRWAIALQILWLLEITFS